MKGVWDLEIFMLFNLIMLAKQGWWLWKHLDSLCAQFLKAKYFANSSVLEAKSKAGRRVCHTLGEACCWVLK